MDDFVLIDLFSQRHAVGQRLIGLDDDTKLAWLDQYGELVMVHPHPLTYHFCSFVGLRAIFFVREGRFIFLGDHTTIGCSDLDVEESLW